MNRILSFLCVSYLLFFVASCDTTSKKQHDLSAYIPKDTKTVIQINNFQDNRSAIASNDLIFPVLTKPVVNELIEHLNPISKSLLCIASSDNTTAYTFITRYNSKIFKSDSIKIKFDKISPITLNKTAFFTLVKDSTLIISSSKKIIEQIDNNQILKDERFDSAYKVVKNEGISILTKKPSFKKTDFVFKEIADWVCLNTTISATSVQATGVALYGENASTIFSCFKGQIPQTNKIYSITPSDVSSVFAFTYNDFDLLQQNLKPHKKDTIEDNFQVFNLVNEVATLHFKSSNAIALRSLDIDATKESLTPFLEDYTTYKNVKIFKFLKPNLINDTFFPLIKTEDISFAFILGDFLVFTSSETLAQHIITSFISEDTFYNTSLFKEVSQDVSQNASFVIIENSERFVSSLSELFGIALESKKITTQFPFAIIQARADQGFTHLNIITQAISLKNKGNIKKVSEIASVALDTTITVPPIFFTNHITTEKEIVVQDVLNKLYLISSNGKVIWKKQLDSPVLGSMQEIDILKNNKKQLVLTTAHSLYVIDRNGNNVSPFPLNFKESITRPVAVFDYDKKRDYRFAVVMGKTIKLYNAKGKEVKGFTFSKAESPIILPPAHIKMGSKDYVLLATQKGKLHILSRIGKPRINVDKNFDFSETPIAREGSNFVVITKDHVKHTIDLKGRVRSKKLKVTGPYYFTTNGNLKVTLDDNLLRINGKLVELPYGIYTPPKIFRIKNNVFVVVLDTQENKIYVYNRNGKLLKDFPVFGMKSASIDYSKGKYLLVTQGDNKTVMVYQIQP